MEFRNLINLDGVRKRYVRVNVYDAGKELTYQTQRNGASIAVRKAANFGGQLIENSADFLSNLITNTVGNALAFFLGSEIAHDLGMFAGTVTGGIAGIASVGLASAVSAGFTQMDFIHQKNNLKDFYADELSAKLNKPAKLVTVGDMEALAEENPVLSEELSRARKQRNFAIPLAVIATLASFAVVMVALPDVLTAMQLAPLAGVSGFLVKAAVSAMTYLAVKAPLQIVGDALFNLTNETVNDRIVELAHAHAKGITITARDLVPVITAVPPTPRALDNLARNINQGTIKPTELLFASNGELVPRKMQHDEAHTHNILSFLDKLGLSKQDPAATFVERLSSQASAERDAHISRYTT